MKPILQSGSFADAHSTMIECLKKCLLEYKEELRYNKNSF